MERASVRLASRCSGERSIRPHHCATFANNCAMMQSSPPSAAAAARLSHARALHARTSLLARAWTAR
eukprot:710659-Lingulodinium_polyedra.AAC.1